MTHLTRNVLWLGFFASILFAWAWLYTMASGMDLDLIGRPGPMGERMAAMNPWMEMGAGMPMAQFGPLFLMWAVMMAAMMLPTLVPTLRAYEDLITSADGTWSGWLGVLLGYALVWVCFAAIIAGVREVTHIAPADEKGEIIGAAVTQTGVINYPFRALGLCAGMTTARFTTTTEVYPDSPKATPEVCNTAQVAAVRAGLDHALSSVR